MVDIGRGDEPGQGVSKYQSIRLGPQLPNPGAGGTTVPAHHTRSNESSPHLLTPKSSSEQQKVMKRVYNLGEPEREAPGSKESAAPVSANDIQFKSPTAPAATPSPAATSAPDSSEYQSRRIAIDLALSSPSPSKRFRTASMISFGGDGGLNQSVGTPAGDVLQHEGHGSHADGPKRNLERENWNANGCNQQAVASQEEGSASAGKKGERPSPPPTPIGPDVSGETAAAEEAQFASGFDLETFSVEESAGSGTGMNFSSYFSDNDDDEEEEEGGNTGGRSSTGFQLNLPDSMDFGQDQGSFFF